eukprot:XP_025985220.1 polygalacturonase 1 beta-like protein 3 [Glycine max]
MDGFNLGIEVGYGGRNLGDKNPFTPKAYVARYWDKHVLNNLPKPSFLLSKASSMSASDTTSFAKLAAANKLSTRLPEFCSAAHLLCFQEVRPSLEKHTEDAGFETYNDGQNFTNYGIYFAGGIDAFKNYSKTILVNDFRRYSRSSAGHGESFTGYGEDTNVADKSFHTYSTNAGGGSGEFKNYSSNSNVPDVRFATYFDSIGGRTQSFSSNNEDDNYDRQSFQSYGKNSADAANSFAGYGTNSNVATLAFINYGVEMNVPEVTFKSYAVRTHASTESFANYRDQANIADDSFQSYAKNTKERTKLDFKNYGNSFNPGSDTFKGYAKGAEGDHKVGFTTYNVNTNATFKDYAKQGVSFASYNVSFSSSSESKTIRRSFSPFLIEINCFTLWKKTVGM